MIKFLLMTLIAVFLSAPTLAAESTLTVHTVVSCTSTTGTALAASDTRVAALLINNGTSTIYLKVGVAAVASEGIYLAAGGGSYYIDFQNANYDTEVINCITASATVVLTVTEWSNQ
jgi:ABC-type Fe3+-hydroxamate transport system substrate-binding protein